MSRAGKNFAANALAKFFAGASLEEKYNLEFSVEQYASALEMKRRCAELFGDLGLKNASIYEAFPDLRKKPLANGMTPIDTWITFGEACRAIYPEVWVSQVFRQIYKDAVAFEKVHYPAQGVFRQRVFIPIVTDLRFDVEFDYFKSHMKSMTSVEILSNHGVVNKADGKLTRKCDLQIENDRTGNFTKMLGEYATTICDHIFNSVKE